MRAQQIERDDIISRWSRAVSELMAAPAARRAWVYLLRCADGSLYAGAAFDLPRRVAQHTAGRASRYTRARLPVTLVWSRRVSSWSAALRAELRIKALRRCDKDTLVRERGPCPRPRVALRRRR
jgi:putative endonuclease